VGRGDCRAAALTSNYAVRSLQADIEYHEGQQQRAGQRARSPQTAWSGSKDGLGHFAADHARFACAPATVHAATPHAQRMRAAHARCAVASCPYPRPEDRASKARPCRTLSRVRVGRASYKRHAAPAFSSHTIHTSASPRTHTYPMTTATTATSPPADIHALLPGLVLTPADGAPYATASRRWAANAERAARYIVQPRTAADVSKAVRAPRCPRPPRALTG
jgi:hypothetical protein